MKLELPDFSAARVLVVGDLMLDRYWHGATSRISPEAPVPVVHVSETEERPGGAANVALNVTALGAQCALLGVTGRDEAGARLRERVVAAGVEAGFIELPDVPTVTKLRVISRHQQLIRLDFEDDLAAFDSRMLLERFEASLPDCGAVVLSDYGKGTLRDPQPFIRAARAAGVPVLVDPKHADFSVYAGASLITPNLAEFEQAAGPSHDEAALVENARRLIEAHGLGGLLVTRGEHGMTLVDAEGTVRHLPTEAREVYDVTGAGDTVIAGMAAGLAAGLPREQAMALANLAAGVVVGKLGTATASVPEIRAALHGGEADRGIVDEAQLLSLVAQARARGERIVMTNGCFDILHAGHVAYLAEARRLGDRLVVAVNDDASVRALKGPGRPVNSLERRMSVLAALAAVDWVVPFSEETPERLICAVRPDVLVKGGDYRPEEIAGGDCVRAAGGEVRVLEYIDGLSTTALIESLAGD